MSARGSAARDERGETLIELIVAVAIMGVSVVVLLGALAAAVANATRQKTDAKGQTVLNAFAEQARKVPFIPCATPGDYNSRGVLAEVRTAAAAEADAQERYVPSVKRVASWDGSAYRAGSTLTAESATTIQVQDPAGLPPETLGSPPLPNSYEVKVDAVDPVAGARTERMTVTGRAGNTLTVTRPAAVAHQVGDAVSVCPPDPPSSSASSYQAQVLDIEVRGPDIAQLGTSETYETGMSVAKRGPLQVPTLTAQAVAPDPNPPRAGDPVTLTDSATISGVDAPNGTMTFSLYGPDQFDPATGACTGAPIHPADTGRRVTSADVPVVGEAVDFVPPKVGRYRWVAAYSGDAANEGVTGTCGAAGQWIEVVKNTPKLTLTTMTPPARSRVVIGDEAQIAAKLEGGATPTGKIRFELVEHFKGNLPCGGPLVTQTPPNEQDLAPVGDTTSLPYRFTEEGTYYWWASYLGDENNTGTGACSPDPVVVSTP